MKIITNQKVMLNDPNLFNNLKQFAYIVSNLVKKFQFSMILPIHNQDDIIVRNKTYFEHTRIHMK